MASTRNDSGDPPHSAYRRIIDRAAGAGKRLISGLRPGPRSSEVARSSTSREEAIAAAEEDFRPKDTPEDISKQISETIQSSISKSFIGQPNTKQLQDQMRQTVEQALKRQNYDPTVKVDFDPNDPTKVSVTMSIQPVKPAFIGYKLELPPGLDEETIAEIEDVLGVDKELEE